LIPRRFEAADLVYSQSVDAIERQLYLDDPGSRESQAPPIWLTLL
jgi:hypothetical protein